jgi:pyridoxine/pyridoxamine 5'-phosphate oxidase
MAGRFVRFIEKRQLESKPEPKPDVPVPAFAVEFSDTQVDFSQKARTFLITHDIATLATLGSNGMLQAVVVYYATDKQNNLYIVTKTKTTKAQNIAQYPQVAFTAYDTSSMQ